MEFRKDYLGTEKIETIYFGGGTPSVLTIGEINQILKNIYQYFDVSKDAEITLEANPDDLNSRYLNSLKRNTNINRLSIGIQSFDDKSLIWMNRRHTGQQAVQSIEMAKKIGFDNINADLIYGIPYQNENVWTKDIQTMTNLEVEHISAYHLTIEENTIFGRRKKKGFITEIEEDESWHQFLLLLDLLDKSGYEQYEISNFAKNQYYSMHNTNYWRFENYLGLGPSAHSFNGCSRQWNKKINTVYIEKINEGKGYFEIENLSDKDRFNEFIMVGLRTKWGIDSLKLEKMFGISIVQVFKTQIQSFLESNQVEYKNDRYTLTKKGKFIADYIIGELFI